MRVGPNPNDRIFHYQGQEKSTEANNKAGGTGHDDVLVQKEITIGAGPGTKKAVIFDRTSNPLPKLVAKLTGGFGPATPEKVQAFFESRGLNPEEAHTVTLNITTHNNKVSARAFESYLMQNNMVGPSDEF